MPRVITLASLFSQKIDAKILLTTVDLSHWKKNNEGFFNVMASQGQIRQETQECPKKVFFDAA